MAAQYGQTWWGQQWLSAFNGIDFSNRLPRGRRYAGNGSVSEITINGTTVTARVQGRRIRPYKVSVRLDEFSDHAQKTILESVSENPAVLSRLLNRQLPEQTLALMTRNKIAIFPRNWNDMKASCSCPDWAMPCKHIAAVIYLIANEIDKNPFLVFQLHGMDLIKALEQQSGVAISGMDAPPAYLDHWHKAPVVKDWQLPEQPVLDNLDLTTIEPLEERLFGILTAKPLFYSKDFRQVMAGIYKRAAKVAAAFDSDAADTVTTELTDFDRLSLVINDNSAFITIESEGNASIPADAIAWHQRLKSLHTEQRPDAVQHYHHALMWQLLYRLAIRLVTRQAYVPAVYEQGQQGTVVLWRPALLSAPVKALLKPLYAVCPPDLVVLEHTPERHNKPVRYYADGKTQVDAALHNIISYFTLEALAQSPGRLAAESIPQLFFSNTPTLFDSFETAEYPKVIRHWLNRLYLGERTHQIHLLVEEQVDDRLSITLQVEHKGQLQPFEQLFSNRALSETKVSVLADLALLAEYLPDIDRLYSTPDTETPLLYTLEAFTPIFLKTLPALKMLGIRLVLPKSLRNLAYPKLNLSIRDSGSNEPVSYLNLDQLLQFDWQVAIGDKRVSAEEFLQLVQGSAGLVRLLDQYVMLDDTRLKDLLKKLNGLPESLSRVQLLKAGLSGELDGATVDLDDSAKALFDQLLRGEPTPLPQGLAAQLRPYQQRGYEWMAQNARIGFGSLLADDMGLGKTLQVITLLLHQKESGQLERHKGLVIAPTSLLTNWRKEIERFAPDLKVQVYHGSQRELKSDDHDIVLTSYGLVRSDAARLGKARWRTVVIDEAQNIKNPGSQQTKAIKQLKSDIRIGLSGTPVENRLREYWSLFDFSNKGYLGTQKKFQDEFAAPIEKDRDRDCLERFRKITAPFILRRLKTDQSIISDLPAKVESNRYCNLSPQQASLYQNTVDNIMEELASSEEGIERRGIIFKLLNALKQICNTPAQFMGQNEAVVAESGKLATFLEICREAMEAGEKILVFTQYTTMGDLLVKSLSRELAVDASFLHGGLARTKRDKLVEDFQNNPRSRMMILSLKAGGTGLNLTAASQVIHYDLWWNPAVEAQATDRAYRIGQKRNVQVHRLITENTFEEKIDAMILSKKELADLTVASGEQWLSELSDDAIRELVSL